MKKIVYSAVLIVLLSCEYDDLTPVCYLASELTISNSIFYSYNNRNQLVTYNAPSVISSVLTYDNSGRIIRELDNGDLDIRYQYDSHGNLILWSQSIDGYPYLSAQSKFFYNAAGQDTLQQYFRFDVATNDFYLWKFIRLNYSSPHGHNYSEKRGYWATGDLAYAENFLWDNHPNPYLKNAFFKNEMPPTNNIVRYTYTLTGGQPQVTEYTYTYNHKGFPVAKAIVGYATIATYTYTNCN